VKPKGIIRILASSVLLAGLTACGGGGGGGDSDDSQVVVDWHGTLAEGVSMSWALEPGIYRLEMTSDHNGASVQWIPNSGCNNFGEVKVYDDECGLDIKGQLKVTNPTTFGLGPSEIVTVKVTRL
jgi:hypothetical protein